MHWCNMSLNMNLELEELIEAYGAGIKTKYYWAPIEPEQIVNDGGLVLDTKPEDHFDKTLPDGD